jgi:hypothetical protein
MLYDECDMDQHIQQFSMKAIEDRMEELWQEYLTEPEVLGLLQSLK